MGKKGRELSRREQDQVYRIHYECVRRNPEYKRDYEKVDAHPWGPEQGRQWLPWQWRLREGDALPDPTQRPPLAKALGRALPPETEASRHPYEFPHARLKGVGYPGGGLVMEYFPEDIQRYARCMVLDMHRPKEHLMRQIEAWIDLILRERTAQGLNQKLVLPRLRVKEYPAYLQVYDLRAEGNTFKEIGESLWPDHGDAEKKAKLYYTRGKELVLNPPFNPKYVTSR
jgi:hypothetical protein